MVAYWDTLDKGSSTELEMGLKAGPLHPAWQAGCDHDQQLQQMKAWRALFFTQKYWTVMSWRLKSQNPYMCAAPGAPSSGLSHPAVRQ